MVMERQSPKLSAAPQSHAFFCRSKFDGVKAYPLFDGQCLVTYCCQTTHDEYIEECCVSHLQKFQIYARTRRSIDGWFFWSTPVPGRRSRVLQRLAPFTEMEHFFFGVQHANLLGKQCQVASDDSRCDVIAFML